MMKHQEKILVLNKYICQIGHEIDVDEYVTSQ